MQYTTSPSLSRRHVLARAAMVGAAGVGGVLLGRTTADAASPPASTTEEPNDASPPANTTEEPNDASPLANTTEEPNDADVGFCTDMTAHHLQALLLCQRVLGRDTGDPVQAAAAEVLQGQAMEVGQMRAWLTDWGQSTALPETVMLWMHGEEQLCLPLGMMPGYATPTELQALSLADGLAKGRMFLELMRAHHVGGVEMADAASTLAATTKVRRLAAAQAAVQTFEISQYDQLLATEYA